MAKGVDWIYELATWNIYLTKNLTRITRDYAVHELIVQIEILFFFFINKEEYIY